LRLDAENKFLKLGKLAALRVGMHKSRSGPGMGTPANIPGPAVPGPEIPGPDRSDPEFPVRVLKNVIKKATLRKHFLVSVKVDFKI